MLTRSSGQRPGPPDPHRRKTETELVISPLLARIAAAGECTATRNFGIRSGSLYRLHREDGDTLGSIAQAAYGTGDYQNIFNANREVIGTIRLAFQRYRS